MTLNKTAQEVSKAAQDTGGPNVKDTSGVKYPGDVTLAELTNAGPAANAADTSIPASGVAVGKAPRQA